MSNGNKARLACRRPERRIAGEVCTWPAILKRNAFRHFVPLDIGQPLNGRRGSVKLYFSYDASFPEGKVMQAALGWFANNDVIKKFDLQELASLGESAG